MSQQSETTMEQARVAADTAKSIVEAEKARVMGVIADELPGLLDKAAREVAHKQVEVTKSIGRERVQALRAELETAGAALADEVRGAAESVDWPSVQSSFDSVDRGMIASAIYFELRQRVDALAAIFVAYGYSDLRRGESTQNLLSPRSLFDESKFGTLASVMAALTDAEQQLEQAKAQHDRSTVDDFWGE